MSGKRLGCGSHEVYITGPGGVSILATVNWSNLTYSRRLDEISDGRIGLGVGQEATCLAVLSNLRPFFHEIAIYRDGAQVWAGPITEISFTYNDIQIQARDVFQWLERRTLTQDHGFVDTDLSIIAAAYIEDAMDPDPSPNLQVSQALSGITGDRSVLATNYRRAADEIRELTRTGLDMTVINREIRFFGQEVTVVPIATLTSEVFEIDSVRLAGLQMANDITVIGSGTSGVSLGPVGVAGGADLPLVSQVYSEPSILDSASATHAAESRYALLKTAPMYINGKLLDTAPVNFADLIPGARTSVDQQVGVLHATGTLRLQSVDVNTEQRDDGLIEAVRLQLQPLGSLGEG